ncbi:MAG: ATP-binding protein [Acidimicrobiales bacterium]
MASGDAGMRAVTLLPTAASSGEARRFAAAVMDDWEVSGALRADVALCVAELAANAAIHTRAPYTVTLRRAGSGMRIDVLDARPEQLPVVVPLVGTVVDMTIRSTTGRGLQIIATLSDRWGVSTSNGAKAVWAELSGHAHDGPAAPTMVIAHRSEQPRGQLLCYLELPVRAAVASGIQTDEAAREVQLAELATPTTGTAQARLLTLLDESAPLRLAGRFAALRAAAEGRERFDLEVVVTDGSLAAVAELAEKLRAQGSAAPSAEVEAFRRWLSEETVSQRRGAAPRRCPLPA